MGIVELPAWRLKGEAPVRAALREGIASARPSVRLVKGLPEHAYCDRCAAPIEFGAVMHGAATYCSVECSLEGPDRPA
jgi:hypothetical protein